MINYFKKTSQQSKVKGAWVTGPGQELIPGEMRTEPTECWQCQSHERRLELGVGEFQQAQLQECGKEDTAPALVCPGRVLTHSPALPGHTLHRTAGSPLWETFLTWLQLLSRRVNYGQDRAGLPAPGDRSYV